MEKYLNSRILIVDDEYANIFFLNKVLTNENYQVISASNGYEAIEILDETEPDLILLDIMMPDITGIEVLQRIKNNQLTSGIPVIMVTAKTDSTDVEMALDLGATEYIKKPVDEIELLARIRTALRIKTYEQTLKENIKSKEDFISIVAHDLRTPFASITGFARFLKEDETVMGKLNEEQSEILDYILDSSQFLVDYFNKLLNWSQMASNKITLYIQDVNLSKLVNTVLVIHKIRVDQKEIKISINIDNDLMIQADEMYFGQVLNNLIGNAIKFTKKNGEINIFSKNDNNHSLVIKDNGIGITDEKINLILSDKPVKSAKGTEGEKGTGLGLKIVKKILDTHKFQFQIKSIEEHGTEFIIVYK